MSNDFPPPSPKPYFNTCFWSALLAVALFLPVSTSHAAVTAGGIAIIGYTDHSDSLGDDDTFSIAALEQIIAGTTVYFTDNGWISADSSFRGATNLDGNGSESLIKLTFTSNVAAGTIMRSGFDGAGFSWQVSGLPTGASVGEYGYLRLASGGNGDQIYAFEADDLVFPIDDTSLPLLYAVNHLYLLDLGDYNNAGFEDASDSATGNITPGLSEVANTAVTLPDPGSGDDPADFHNGSFALNMLDADVVALNVSGATKEQWLAVIADSANWKRDNYVAVANGDPDAESQLSALNITGVPEPSRAVLIGCAALLVSARRRRRAV